MERNILSVSLQEFYVANTVLCLFSNHFFSLYVSISISMSPLEHFDTLGEVKEIDKSKMIYQAQLT
jgi:hypothetical protein